MNGIRKHHISNQRESLSQSCSRAAVKTDVQLVTKTDHICFLGSPRYGYVSIGMVDRLTWNKKEIHRMSAGIYLWDLDLSPHPWPWSCIFKVRFWHSLISGIGRAITHITKAMWVDSKLDPLHVCDLKDFQGQISKTPYVVKPTVTLTFDRPWPWTRIVKVKFSESYTSATGGSLDIERKGYESDTMLDTLCQLELLPQL